MQSLIPGRQDDGSIVDIYGNIISEHRALEVITQVNSLPAVTERDNFLYALNEHPIVIVQGETGSGKSTQLPKMAHLENPGKHIVVTQPRRLSASSLAERVSFELLCTLGDPHYSLGHNIGYRTGVGKMATHRTRLGFHTDGTEGMRQTMSDCIPDMLFIDEVHGFSPHTEVLAMLSRHHQRAMKLVIMSATLDPEIFRDYYRKVSRDIPLISIPGRTFGVTTNFDAPESSFENDLADAIRAKQNILIFTPGKKEIETLIQELQEKFGRSAEIFPLHAEMSISEQNMLLTKTTTLPRIVVATNIAEESITIPYMYMVADFGTQKVLRYTRRGIPTLGVENTALANCTQRAGRVGRTRPGSYNRYNDTSSTDLLPYPEAPIQREMIDRHILTLLSEGIDIIDMIYDGASKNETPFFHHVDIGLFEISLTRLRAIGALTSNNQLTVLGHELLKFPVDVYHARMLYESIERQCTGNMINIVSILEKKGFVSSKELEWKVLLSQKQYSSDLRAYSELLELCIGTTITSKQLKKLINLGINPDELTDFLERDGNMKLYEVVDLSPIGIKNKKIKEIDECREILIDRFASMGIELTNAGSKMSQSIAIASGYMHNVFVFDEEHEQFKPEKGTSYENYKQGNVSVVIPQPLNHYLGNPFIILGKGKVSNFSLLTQIMEVSDLARATARKSNQFYAQEEYQKPTDKTISKHSQDLGFVSRHDSPKKQVPVPESQTQISQDTPNTDTRTTQVLNGEIQPLYESLIREFQLTNHESSDDAQIFYLDNCLIPFLFEYNSHIKKYIARKSDNWKQFFSRLLIRFLRENDLYRINPNNIAKTESSFRHDADIIRRFQESTDSVIRDFRLHGIPKKSTNQLPTIGDTIPNNIQLEKVGAMKRQYSKLLGQIKHYLRVLPLHEIEIFALENTLKNIEESKFDDKINQAYLEIDILIQELKGIPEREIRKMAKSIKQIGIKRKELNKNLGIHKKMTNFLELLNANTQTDSDRKKFIEALHFAFFVPLDDNEKKKYLTFVDRITSFDDKKRRRVRANKKTGLKYYQGIVERNIESVDSNIEKFEGLVNLDNCIYAKEILEKLGIIVQGIFHDDYIMANMETRFYEIMRAIIRDNITTKKGLYHILFEGLQRNQMGQHMNGVSNLYNLLVKHDDLQFGVDSYRQGGAIYTSMLASRDPSEIEGYINGLQKLLEQLQKSVRNVDENKLWQKYCKSRTNKSI